MKWRKNRPRIYVSDGFDAYLAKHEMAANRPRIYVSDVFDAYLAKHDMKWREIDPVSMIPRICFRCIFAYLAKHKPVGAFFKQRNI